MSLKEIVERDGARYVELMNPATGEAVTDASGQRASIRVSEEADVREAVNAANEAFRYWSALDHRDRRAYLRELELTLADNAREVALLSTRETGKPLGESMAEVYGILEGLHFFPRQAKKLAKPRWRTPTSLVNIGKPYRILRVPKGVLAYITPWNYPMAILMPIFQSLSAGNAVLLKPSTETPLGSVRLQQIAAEVWRNFAKVPCPLQIIVGPHRITGAAIMDELARGNIADVSLTGSVQAGVDVNQKVAKWLKSPVLELGGKDPVVVCDDADAEKAAHAAVFAAFYNCGQTCCAVERVYVTRASADAFLKKATELVAAIKAGDGARPDVTMGPQINLAQVEKTEEHVKDAVDKGAKILHGGSRLTEGEYANGFFHEPTLLTDVSHDMLVMTEETFGPTLPVMVVDTEEQAVRMANDCKYGLNASVWSRDLRKGYDIASRIEAGVVYINDVLWAFSDPSIPWVGIKSSGRGASQGEIGFYHCTHPRVIVKNRTRRFLPLDSGNPWMRSEPDKVRAFIEDAIRFQHGRSGRLAASLRSTKYILHSILHPEV